jgi:hypothetical protein
MLLENVDVVHLFSPKISKLLIPNSFIRFYYIHHTLVTNTYKPQKGAKLNEKEKKKRKEKTKRQKKNEINP